MTEENYCKLCDEKLNKNEGSSAYYCTKCEESLKYRKPDISLLNRDN